MDRRRIGWIFVATYYLTYVFSISEYSCMRINVNALSLSLRWRVGCELVEDSSFHFFMSARVRTCHLCTSKLYVIGATLQKIVTTAGLVLIDRVLLSLKYTYR